jgi:hypothetical protein
MKELEREIKIVIQKNCKGEQRTHCFYCAENGGKWDCGEHDKLINEIASLISERDDNIMQKIVTYICDKNCPETHEDCFKCSVSNDIIKIFREEK